MLLRGTAASRGNRACGRHAVNAAVLSLLVGVIVLLAPWAASAASGSVGHTVPAVAVYNGEFHVDYRTTSGTIQNTFWNGSQWVQNAVPGPAATGDPAVAVYNSNGTAVASNNNWKETQQVELTNAGFAMVDDREAALLAILSPGPYTAIVTDQLAAIDSHGIALLEIYNAGTQ